MAGFFGMGINKAYARETLGERVKRLRLAKGMTQAQLGQAAGYAGNMPINALEKGRTKNAPEALNLAAMARALDVSVHDLLNGEDAAKPEAEACSSAGLASLLASGRPLRPSTRKSLLALDRENAAWTEAEWNVLADVFEGMAATNETAARALATTTPVPPKRLKR